MAHFAKLDATNIVLDVVVVNNAELMDDGIEREAKGVAFLVEWSGGYPYWKQTSYNGSFRKNFATIGGFFDPLLDAFIAPKPYPSWILNEQTCVWNAPVPYPDDGQLYIWDEATLSWVLAPELN